MCIYTIYVYIYMYTQPYRPCVYSKPGGQQQSVGSAKMIYASPGGVEETGHLSAGHAGFRVQGQPRPSNYSPLDSKYHQIRTRRF